MAFITGKKHIFFVTSPRSPNKLLGEIKFLTQRFSGQSWNKETQENFYLELAKQDFFEGSASGDIALKARDRITRAPKSLGFVDLKPIIQLTEAGKRFVYGKRPEEALLRQLLKFQLSSPYHVDKAGTFHVKPYLELMRLVYDLEGLSKNEIALFVVQLINVADYDFLKDKILRFRVEVKGLREKKVSFKNFVKDTFTFELSRLFQSEIQENDIVTRQSKNSSLEKFISTKRKNFLDYADAAIRYLRSTGLFTIDPRTFKIRVLPEKIRDLEYVLANTPRNIQQYVSKEEYEAYLFNPESPKLLTDSTDLLIEKISAKDSSYSSVALRGLNVDALKDIYYDIVANNLHELIAVEKAKLKTYAEYEDILKTFSDIAKKDIADPPLFLEWNVWRAFAMLNDGDISGNFKVDDDGVPLYTAPGNAADIVCKYRDFEAIVEVTMSSGHRQYEMEGEPVARHYGDHKKATNKDVYCIFIAPTISEAAIAHYYILHRTNVEKYGGNAKIIPVALADFKQLLENAYKATERPTSIELNQLWKELSDLALKANSETEWFAAISSIVRTSFMASH